MVGSGSGAWGQRRGSDVALLLMHRRYIHCWLHRCLHRSLQCICLEARCRGISGWSLRNELRGVLLMLIVWICKLGWIHCTWRAEARGHGLLRSHVRVLLAIGMWRHRRRVRVVLGYRWIHPSFTSTHWSITTTVARAAIDMAGIQRLTRGPARLHALSIPRSSSVSHIMAAHRIRETIKIGRGFLIAAQRSL